MTRCACRRFLGKAAATLAAVLLIAVAVGLFGRGAPRDALAGQVIAQASPASGGESGGYSTSFSLAGMIANAATFSLADLEAMPAQAVNVQFISGAGLEQHTYQGVPLYALLMAAGPQFSQAQKNDRLAWYVDVRAVDGYQAVVSWGELDPGWEGKNVLVAYEADGQLLGSGDGMARLVVPGDTMGGRYVSSISSITLERASGQ